MLTFKWSLATLNKIKEVYLADLNDLREQYNEFFFSTPVFLLNDLPQSQRYA